jgi:hypothetical protein
MAQLGAILAVSVALLLAAGASAARFYNEKGHLMLRGLRKVLGGQVEAHLIDRARGRAIGFNFAKDMMAVTWNAGEWCLVYRIEELRGAELIVDGWVTGWAFADEPRSSSDVRAGAKEHVVLQLTFEDARYVDFQLELWSRNMASESTASGGLNAIELGNRWLADIHELLNRAPAAAAVPAEPTPVTRTLPGFRNLASES